MKPRSKTTRANWYFVLKSIICSYEIKTIKRLIIPIMIIPLLIFGCSPLSTAEEVRKTVIKEGMEFEKAKKILQNFGAREVFLQIKPVKSTTGEYMEVKCYALPKKPYIIINYQREKGKNIIRDLTLYYEYQYKGHPDNKWLHVKEIDLRNIRLNSGEEHPQNSK